MPTETTPLPSPLVNLLLQRWAQQQGIHDLDHPDSHYDYRGFFMSGAPHQPGTHFPDTFKQHGHPTFSNESQYSRGLQDGGRWLNDVLVPTPVSSH